MRESVSSTSLDFKTPWNPAELIARLREAAERAPAGGSTGYVISAEENFVTIGRPNPEGLEVHCVGVIVAGDDGSVLHLDRPRLTPGSRFTFLLGLTIAAGMSIIGLVSAWKRHSATDLVYAGFFVLLGVVMAPLVSSRVSTASDGIMAFVRSALATRDDGRLH